jgi:4-carboxymuconolactone decarboxylase
MNGGRFFKWVMLFLLSTTFNTMKAQQSTTAEHSLDVRQQSIVSISALTAIGDLDSLKTALNTGLDAGLTINEIKETLVQLYAYCGFPRSLNSLNMFMKVLDERKAKGISDNTGKEIVLDTNTKDKYETGRSVLEALTKRKQPKPAPGFGEFAPRIDAFLKEHLFADIFESDVLTFKQRELVTIAALTAMTGVESQLEAHVGIGKNTGITENQLLQVSDLIEKCINKTQANTLRKVLSSPTSPVIEKDMMVRIADIEIFPQYLEEYKAILKQEAAASIKVEPGVLIIFPMYEKENSTRIKIVEVYSNKVAYESHLQANHFMLYKTSTAKMIKSLKLADMETIDTTTMQAIFKKLN